MKSASDATASAFSLRQFYFLIARSSWLQNLLDKLLKVLNMELRWELELVKVLGLYKESAMAMVKY